MAVYKKKSSSPSSSDAVFLSPFFPNKVSEVFPLLPRLKSLAYYLLFIIALLVLAAVFVGSFSLLAATESNFSFPTTFTSQLPDFVYFPFSSGSGSGSGSSSVPSLSMFKNIIPPRDHRTTFILHKHLLVPLVLLHLTLVFSLKRPYVRYFAFPFVVGGFLNPILTATSRHWPVAFLGGAALFYIALTAVNYLLLVDIYEDERFWLEQDEADEDGVPRNPAELTFFQRGMWVANLLANHRGIGRGFRPKGVAEHRNGSDSPEYNSRLAFFWAAATRAFGLYLAMDAIGYVVSVDPFFRERGCWKSFTPFLQYDADRISMFDGRCLPPMVASFNNVVVKIAYIICRNSGVAVEVCALLTGLYDTLSIVAVCILRLDEPKDWPPLFGPFGSCFYGRNRGLRNFWGKFWHQTFRMQMSLPSEIICRFLFGDETTTTSSTTNGHANGYANGYANGKTEKKKPKNRALRNHIRVLVTFTNSGLLHLAGCTVLGVRGYGSFTWFAIQPLGLFLEEVFLKILFPRSSSPAAARQTRLGSAFSVFWMVAWLQLTCGFFFCDFINGGEGLAWDVPVSLWRLATGGVGETWRWGHPGGWVRWDESAWGWGVAL